MANYTRLKSKGGTYFFSVRLADRQSDALVRHIGVLRKAFRETQRQYPFRIDAIVVLPAAVHTIWTLPHDDDDFSYRWSLIKTRFSRVLPVAPARTGAQIRRGEKGIWQRRFWEHLIRSREDFALHEKMIHMAPVEAGLVGSADRWVWSSIHRNARLSPPGGASGDLWKAAGADKLHPTAKTG